MESYTRSKLSSRRKPKSKRHRAGGVQVTSDFNVFLASMPLGDENEELFDQIIARNCSSAAREIDLEQ